MPKNKFIAFRRSIRLCPAISEPYGSHLRATTHTIIGYGSKQYGPVIELEVVDEDGDGPGGVHLTPEGARKLIAILEKAIEAAEPLPKVWGRKRDPAPPKAPSEDDEDKP